MRRSRQPSTPVAPVLQNTTVQGARSASQRQAEGSAEIPLEGIALYLDFPHCPRGSVAQCLARLRFSDQAPIHPSLAPAAPPRWQCCRWHLSQGARQAACGLTHRYWEPLCIRAPSGPRRHAAHSGRGVPCTAVWWSWVRETCAFLYGETWNHSPLKEGTRCLSHACLSRSAWCLTQRRLSMSVCWWNKCMKRQKMQSCRKATFGKGRACGPLSPHPGGLGSEEEGILSGGGRGGSWGASAVLSGKARFTTSHLAAFQRLMNSFLSGLIYDFDDVIINSPSCELHLKDLNEVLVRTQETGIAIKWKKCQFWEKTVNFLGH